MMITVQQAIQDLKVVARQGDENQAIVRVVYDSRKVQPGDLFVALRGGHTDGHLFVDQAVQKGAVAVLVEEPVDVPCWIQVEDTLSALAVVAKRVYGNPADKLGLIGVTGSNGKTTTTYIIESIGLHAGESMGLLGTVEYRWPGVSQPAPHTTPFSSDLQEGLSLMVKAGVSQVVMEVSSHALSLHRVDTLLFDVAVFTNLSHEHLDFHGNMENYAEAKFRLFHEFLKPHGFAVLNLDDRVGRSWVTRLDTKRLLTYSFSSPAKLYPETIQMTARGIDAQLNTPWGLLRIESNLIGRHNFYNLMAAAGACLGMGISPEQVESGIRQPICVPGRLESIQMGQPFSVLVDYAHTPDGLKQVLTTLSELHPKRLICLAGAGGDRDRKKRPLMASLAQELADIVILTSDNPRTEDPEMILNEMELGMRGSSGSTYLRIVDRHQAIQKALELAQPGDIVLIAGKGHETYQEIQGIKHPFDDREECRKVLQNLGFRGGKA